MGFALGTIANETYTKNMKCTWPTPAFCVGTQRNLYSIGWRQGLTSGKTQILALGNAKIYQHVGISNAKCWRRGHCPTPTPRRQVFCVTVEYRLKSLKYESAYLPIDFNMDGICSSVTKDVMMMTKTLFRSLFNILFDFLLGFKIRRECTIH